MQATEAAVPDVPAGTVQPVPKTPQKISEEPSNDFWEFDKGKGAWCKIHIRPRKRLFAPVGNDCPFGADDVSSKRVTEWKCKGKVSYHTDDWQSNPYQRISSKSWVGKTWFYPKNDVDAKRATIQAAVANARQQQNLLKGEEAAMSMLEGLTNNVRDPIIAMLSKVETQNHSEARKKAAKGPEAMFEFCCSENSSLGKVHEEKGIMHFRLTKESNDLSDPDEIASLQKMLKQFPNATLWGSLPCDPWSKWQALNIAKYGSEFAKKLKKKRQLSRKMLKHFLETAERVLCQGGHIAFEWPKGAKG